MVMRLKRKPRGVRTVIWWGGWDLNPQGISTGVILSPLRLPIPPPPRGVYST